MQRKNSLNQFSFKNTKSVGNLLKGDEFRKTVQLLRFTEFLQENPKYIRGRLSHDEFLEKKGKFNLIAIELNTLGPIQRNGEQWYQYFKSLKQNLFGKVYTRRYSIRHPGQLLDKKYHLMEWERRIVEMLGLQGFLVPNPVPLTQENPDFDEDFHMYSSDTDNDDDDDYLAVQDVDGDCHNDNVDFNPTSVDEEEEEAMMNYVTKLKEEKEDFTPEPPMKKFKETPLNDIKQEILEMIDGNDCQPNIKLEPKDITESESDHECKESDQTTIASKDIKKETIEAEHLEDNEENTSEAISSENYFYIKILNDQASTQKRFYKKMYDDMENIQNSLKSIEEGVKLSAEHKNELLELKKEKLRMYREWKIEKKNIADAKLRIKTELVEFEERKPKVEEK